MTANRSKVEPQYEWEVREEYVRNTKTGDVFYPADACPRCYKPRFVAWRTGMPMPDLIVHCTHYKGQVEDV